MVLGDAYVACAFGRPRAAVRALLEAIDGWLRASALERVAAILREADLDRLDAVAAIGLLAAALPTRGTLPEYAACVARVRERLGREYASGHVDVLLRGLT